MATFSLAVVGMVPAKPDKFVEMQLKIFNVNLKRQTALYMNALYTGPAVLHCANHYLVDSNRYFVLYQLQLGML